MKYKKILLKFSGEAFGPKGGNVDPAMVAKVALEIKKLTGKKARAAVVCGGGNIARGREANKEKQLFTHFKGMRGTLINATALLSALKKIKVKAKIYSSFSLKSKFPNFDQARAMKDWDNGTVLIFAGGTGHPYFTTDTAAVLRALQLKAEVFIKVTKVDGVYSCDPLKNKNCKKFRGISYKKIIESELGIIDKMAIALAWENNLPIEVIKWEQGNVLAAADGKRLGTLIN